MKNDIKEKLQSVLNKENFKETDVIYILSRIRKLLEIDGNRKDYKVLNFYCNWALHAQIEDVDSISKPLQKPGENVISLFHLFTDFDKELKKFLGDHDIQTSIFTNRETLIKFHHLLTEIYTDTPLILKTISKKRITFRKEESFGKNSGLFSTTYEEL